MDSKYIWWSLAIFVCFSSAAGSLWFASAMKCAKEHPECTRCVEEGKKIGLSSAEIKARCKDQCAKCSLGW